MNKDLEDYIKNVSNIIEIKQDIRSEEKIL